jgi:hypothetical protein
MLLLHIVYPAFKSILVNRLQKILHDYKNPDSSVTPSNFSDRSSASLQRGEPADEIPLNRVQREDQIWYVSAIAFRLTDHVQGSATDIAVQLIKTLIESTVSSDADGLPLPLDRVWSQVLIQLTAPGWIHFKFSDQGLAEWLQIVSECLLSSSCIKSQDKIGKSTPYVSSTRNFTNSFEVLYTHARCCTLLRLGEQADILRLHSDPDQLAVWRIIHPNPIPWCSDQTLRCHQPAERRLIMQIVSVLDELCLSPVPSTDRIWLLAQRLSQDFQAFYAHCSIFAVAKIDRALAQARLGLVLLTQTLLRWLLQDWLHLKAPIEL